MVTGTVEILEYTSMERLQEYWGNRRQSCVVLAVLEFITAGNPQNAANLWMVWYLLWMESHFNAWS